MGWTNETEHFNFPQFVDNDKPTWRGDINYGFGLMDSILMERVGDVREFGAIGDGIADDTAALHAALEDAKATDKNVVKLPPGDYMISETLIIPAGVRFTGEASPPRSANGTRIVFTGATGPAVTSDGSRFAIENMAIIYTNPEFTGTVINAGSDSEIYRAHTVFRNLWIGSLINDSEFMPVGGYPADSCVDLHGAQNVLFENCHFYGADYNISGIDPTKAGLKHAIVVAFRSCTFHRHNKWAVRNPHYSWSFDSCTFERSEDLSGRALIVEAEANPHPSGVNFNSCWFGDNSEPGHWIEWHGKGLVINGGRAVNGGSMVKMLSGNATIIGIDAFAAVPGAGYAMVDVTEAANLSSVTVALIGCTVGGYGTSFKDGVKPPHYFEYSDRPGQATKSGKFEATEGGSLSSPGVGFGPQGGLVNNTVDNRFSIVKGGTEFIRLADNRIFMLADFTHYGSKLGFFGKAGAEKTTLPHDSVVTAADIAQALRSLGLVG